MKYAIIDIETTGGSPVSEKITEIAIYIHDGTGIVDEFSSLINPEKKIPYHITNLTGITNEMVEDAPKFYEVAKKIVELTDDTIFVAHNASFDYNFIKQEFKRLGYNFKKEQLCTVKLSRKLIPGLRSYSLGKICNELGIKITDRHRAAGDALATSVLFNRLMEISNINGDDFSELPGISKKDLHPDLNPEVIKNLPEETGIYYFYNDKNDLVYIGKSKDIKTRVMSHFRNYTTKKGIEMMQSIASIDYNITGSELIALLRESEEIKINKPLYNRAQRRSLFQYGLYSFVDNSGYIRFYIEKNCTNCDVPLNSFTSKRNALSYINRLIDDYRLCQKLCGVYESSGPCFHYHISLCDGACTGEENPESYNQRAGKVLEKHQFQNDSFFIIDKGRHDEEFGIVKVEKGKYMGLGYVDKEILNGNFGILNDSITAYKDNRDVYQIIRGYLQKNQNAKMIYF